MTDQSCPRDELLAGLDAGALSPAEERELRAHLPACEVCRTALEENREAARALRSLAAPRPSQAARDRAYAAVLAAMENGQARAAESGPMVKARAAEGGPMVKPSQASATKSARSAKPAPPAAPRSWFSFRIVAGGVAAAACVLVVVSLQFSSMPRGFAPAAAPQDLAFASPRAARAEDAAKRAMEEKEQSIQAMGLKPEEPGAPAAPKPMTPAPPAPMPAMDDAQDESKNKLARDAGLRGNLDGTMAQSFAAKDKEPVELEIRRKAGINEAIEVLIVRDRLNYLEKDKARRSRALSEDGKKKADKPDEDQGRGGAAPVPPGANGPRNDAKPETPQTPQKKAATKGELADEPKQSTATAEKAGAALGERFRDPKNPDQGVFADDAGHCYMIAADDLDRALITSKTLVSRDNPVMMRAVLRILDAELEKQPHDEEWARRVLLLAEAAGEDTHAADAAKRYAK